MTMLEPQQAQALRGMLLDTVSNPSPHRPHRVAITALAAGALAATLVVAGIVVPGAASTAQAADALRSAARGAIDTSDPAVGPGQFLKVSTRASYLAGESDASQNLSGYLSPSLTELYIPADDGVDWVQRVTAEPASAFFGATARRAAERDWALTVADGVVRVTRAPHGEFAVGHELGGDREHGQLPSTPAAALEYLRALNAGGSDVDVMHNAAQLLRDGTMKARERATIYEAIALLPGIRIADDRAVLDGRKGVAFSLEDGWRRGAVEIVIDPLDGQFIGERQVAPEASGAIPAGTTISSTAVTTSVVDSAP